MFAIDILVPKKFGSTPIDLVVSGPNEGSNAGPFVYTLSGTVGAAYISVERGVRLRSLMQLLLALINICSFRPSRSPAETRPTAHLLP